MKTFLTIGEFSQAARISPKALRLYQREGILVPAWIDEATGYRYYLPSQFAEAHRVRWLRNLEIPLEEIRTFLRQKDPGDMRRLLEEYRRRLRRRMEKLEADLKLLERVCAEGEEAFFGTYEIRLRRIPSLRALTRRFLVDKTRFDEEVDEAFRVLHRAGERLGAEERGPEFCLFHRPDLEESHWDVECCLPVNPDLPGTGQSLREIRGCLAACTLHLGPYEEIEGAYGALLRWMDGHNLLPRYPSRETYLHRQDPGGAEPLRVELLWPVRRKPPKGEEKDHAPP
ncbi:transcriptional regulator, MerR family [Aminomonas paucivorans DSM 12260]|uniref:Transcriptional regulator, MerR family n=1 Tax=Aminomonas paucivorans DSM 12260 TaxID=584708 RepID=E3D058_9BACT|nr:MerR family transcriptional regulator [Aminomonas paucivorans]EFQ24731.1 transcriptional regulator, MerR family [Aminomonas paucivorans DSM 12260]